MIRITLRPTYKEYEFDERYTIDLISSKDYVIVDMKNDAKSDEEGDFRHSWFPRYLINSIEFD